MYNRKYGGCFISIIWISIPLNNTVDKSVKCNNFLSINQNKMQNLKSLGVHAYFNVSLYTCMLSNNFMLQNLKATMAIRFSLIETSPHCLQNVF